MGAHREASRPKEVRLLLISDDPNLTVTRLLLLQIQGYSAEHLFSRQMADFGRLRDFEIFLICQSISWEKAREFIARIRREAPWARILRVRNVGQHEVEQADLMVASPAGPFELVKGLELLANRKLQDRREEA